jgi:hypothetical protein
MDFWRNKIGIPGVIISIDGSHISIIQSRNTRIKYYNHYDYYNINIQDYIPRFILLTEDTMDHHQRFIEYIIE